MAFKEVNRVDQQTRYAVHGWMRRQQSELEITNLPPILAVIIVLYYRSSELFDIISKKCIKLSENKTMITKQGQLRGKYKYENNNYGSMEIDSTSNGVYQWDLNIVKCGWIYLGVAWKYTPNRSTVLYVGDPGHYIFGHDATARTSDAFSGPEYGECWKDGDIVSIVLDLDKAELSLMINDKDQGVAFTSIERSVDIKYRLFACLTEPEDCVEILNFSAR